MGVGKHKALIVGASTAAAIGAGTVVAVAPLAAEPDGEKDCGSVLPSSAAAMAASQASIDWAQKGGSVNDASCLSRTAVAGIVTPHSEKDVATALTQAKVAGLTPQ